MASRNPIYDNCEILAPDGKLVGLCNRKRYRWYLEKGIAEKVDGSDKAIKLKFEPKYKNNSPSDSVRIKRQNKCYVCGSEENLTRFHVFPPEYKKLLPEEWKSHNSIDLLPLCTECSAEANWHAQGLKDLIESEYGISKDNFIDFDKLRIKTVSKKILNNRKHGLDDRALIDELSPKLGTTITDDVLLQSSLCDISAVYEGSRSPTEYIMKRVINDNSIGEFIRRWKDYFVETMKPTDLPEDFYCNH
jgi:hypothetical protein